MHRVVSLFLPTWPTDRLRRRSVPALRPDEPLATALREGGRRIVADADAAARACGIHPGLSVAQARALTPDLILRPADSEGDARDLARLALWCAHRYSPIVAPEPPDGILIDAAGCAHLHGGEAAMLNRLAAAFEKAGIAVRAALADTPAAARAVARWGAETITIIPPGEQKSFLAPLSAAALDLAPETADDLRRLGFETISALATAPRGSLAARFGPELLRRLDLAFGERPEPIIPLAPPQTPRVETTLAEPISAREDFVRVIADLTERLCRELEKRGLGARRLDLLFHGVDNRLQAARIGTSRPSRDPRGLARLLGDRLEQVDPGFGVEIMSLAASLVEPFAADQRRATFAGHEDAALDLSSLIDTLGNRLGPSRLYRAAPVESDVPERSVRHVPPLSAFSEGEAWPYADARPIRIFSPPEPITAIAALPDHPPKSFIWRGRRHRVVRADGPERIYGEWWKRPAELSAVRDYFRVEDEAGHRFWVFRRGDGEDPSTGAMRWFMHGLFA